MSVKHGRRLLAYGLAVLALCSVPYAWATPEAGWSGQGVTVPTPTPRQIWTPSPAPGRDLPSPTPAPGVTLTPVTPGPLTTPTPTATASGAPALLTLTQEVAPLLAWPGVRVDYVLTVRNVGAASARQVLLEAALPEALDPVALSAANASPAWEGHTLRGRVAILPPGGQAVVRFSAIVRADAIQGRLLVTAAQATVAGAPAVQAEAFIVLPPITLPVVGAETRAEMGRR